MTPNYVDECNLNCIIQDLVDNVKRQVIHESNSEIKSILNENAKLKKENKELQKSINDITSQNNDNNLFESIWGNIKNNLMKKVPPEKQFTKNNKIYDFLSLIYDKDYVEELDTNTPLWIGILTQWYSHKNEMIQIMDSLGISYEPEDLSDKDFTQLVALVTTKGLIGKKVSYEIRERDGKSRKLQQIIFE